MTKNIQITNGGIEKILNMTNINKEENIDMYFTLIDSKIFSTSSINILPVNALFLKDLGLQVYILFL